MESTLEPVVIISIFYVLLNVWSFSLTVSCIKELIGIFLPFRREAVNRIMWIYSACKLSILSRITVLYWRTSVVKSNLFYFHHFLLRYKIKRDHYTQVRVIYFLAAKYYLGSCVFSCDQKQCISAHWFSSLLEKTNAGLSYALLKCETAAKIPRVPPCRGKRVLWLEAKKQRTPKFGAPLWSRLFLWLWTSHFYCLPDSSVLKCTYQGLTISWVCGVRSD